MAKREQKESKNGAFNTFLTQKKKINVVYDTTYQKNV